MEPLKLLIDIKLMKTMATELEQIESSFNSKKFLKNAQSELDGFELKQRIQFIAQRTHTAFDNNEFLALTTLLELSKKRLFTGFKLWPALEYVGLYGHKHFELSFNCIEVMTQDFTAEFAIRSFIKNDLNKVNSYLNKWITHPNEHLRRLASEGTRPLLPWGMKLNSINENPELTWWIIESLKDDSSAYVRKSVANHINDFSKSHPDFVIKKLKAWKRPSENSKWIIRHALRTLLKKAHPGVLSFYEIDGTYIDFDKFKIMSKSVLIGGIVEYEVKITNQSKVKQKVILDSNVHLLKSNGSYIIKCFKGKSLNLEGGQSTLVKVKIPIRIVTTRKYYPGKHFLSLLINGNETKKLSFNLEK